MRREIGIGGGAGFRDVAGFSVFEALAHAVAEEEIHSGLRRGVCWRLTEEQRTERVILREFVFEGFDEAGRGDGSGDEGDPDGFEWLRRKGFCGEAGPEAVTVTGDGGKSGDAVRADEIVDFGAFEVGGAMIAAAETGVACAGPRFGSSACGEILGIGAEVECAGGVAPDFPGGPRRVALIEEPRILFGPRDCLRRVVLPEIRDFGFAVAN